MRLPGFLCLLGNLGARRFTLGFPLEDIRNTEAIRMVMKNGRLYQGDDLQEIWPRKRSLPAFWWATEVPGGKADGQPGGG
jgi:hypothetical protein